MTIQAGDILSYNGEKITIATEPPSQRTKTAVKNGQQSNDRQNASTYQHLQEIGGSVVK